MQVMSGARTQMTVAGQGRAQTFDTTERTDGTAAAGAFAGAAFAGAATARGKGHGCGSEASCGGVFRGGHTTGARRRPSDNHRPVAPRPAYRGPDTGTEAVRRG